MYVKINRDACGHHIATCERCLGRFLTHPYGYERQCFEEIIEDGSEDVTLDIVSGDSRYHMTLNEEARLMMAGEGWAKILEQANLL